MDEQPQRREPQMSFVPKGAPWPPATDTASPRLRSAGQEWARLAAEWAADDRKWNTQEVVKANLIAFINAALAAKREKFDVIQRQCEELHGRAQRAEQQLAAERGKNKIQADALRLAYQELDAEREKVSNLMDTLCFLRVVVNSTEPRQLAVGYPLTEAQAERERVAAQQPTAAGVKCRKCGYSLTSDLICTHCGTPVQPPATEQPQRGEDDYMASARALEAHKRRWAEQPPATEDDSLRSKVERLYENGWLCHFGLTKEQVIDRTMGVIGACAPATGKPKLNL